MNQAANLVPSPAMDAATALREVTAFAEAILQTLRLSRALLSAERRICLDGLEAQIGQLCARCLGLDREAGTGLRVHLLAVRAELDATALVLTTRQEAAPCRSTTS